jgi:sarcosine oxidase subunit beta
MLNAKSADAVIIGGGIRGCSIALFLARAGVRVVLLERRYVAFMASSANGGQVNVTDKAPDHYTAMSLASARMYPEFIASLEANIYLQQEGILHVALNEEEMERLRQRVGVLNRIPGLHAEILDGKQAKDLVPALTPKVIGGYVSKADGVVEVLKLVPAMVRAARRAGAVLQAGVEVTGIEVKEGRVQSVHTDQGTISTPAVINAAGVHVPHIGRMAGLSIPVDPEHGHLIISQPYPRIVPIPTSYITQWPNGSLLLGTTNNKIGYDTRVRPRWLPPFVQEAISIVPKIKEVKALRVFAQIRPMPPDRLPIYDRATGVEGFYIVVGHSGITLAPLTGRVFADWITKGKPDMDLSPYSLKRFEQHSEN